MTGKRETTKVANRTAILDAAREVFADLGYGAASVRDIVRGTDLASGTFYNYFPDKEAVLRALVEESVVELRAALTAARSRAQTLEAFVEDGFRAYFGYIAADPPTFELLRRNAGTIRAMMHEPPSVAGVAELVAELQERIDAGQIPPVDVAYVGAAMSGTAIEVAIQMLERDPIDVEGAVAFATDLFVGGLGRIMARA